MLLTAGLITSPRCQFATGARTYLFEYIAWTEPVNIGARRAGERPADLHVFVEIEARLGHGRLCPLRYGAASFALLYGAVKQIPVDAKPPGERRMFRQLRNRMGRSES